MRRIVSQTLRFCALSGLLVSGIMGGADASFAADSKPAGWVSSFEAAQLQAREKNLPILLHFYADWCGPCRSMESSVLNQPEVLSVLGTRCVAMKVNVDHHGDLKSRFGVAALPTDVFVSPEGDVLSRSVGGTTRGSYVARIEEMGRRVRRHAL